MGIVPKIKLSRRKVGNAQITHREFPVAHFIPYKCHWDHNTVMTKNKELLQVIKLDGFSFETADDEDVDLKKAVRNSLFRSMASGTFACWFHIVRRRQSAFPKGNFQEGFAEYINEQWKRKHHSRSSYTNDLYITVVRKADTAGAAKLEHWYRMLYGMADKESADVAIKEAHKELEEAVYRIVATLKEYGPRVLGVVETDRGAFSEPLEFLGRLVNCGDSQPMLVPSMDISHYLPSNRLFFGGRSIEARSPTSTRFAALVSVKEYAASTAAGLLDSFLQLPFEFIISQSYTYINRQTAIEKMSLQQRRMMNAEDVAVSQIAEISDALDMAMSGHVAFGEHHMSVLCIEENLRALEDSVSMAIAELVNIGVNATRESFNLDACYWAQLPGNFDYIGRKATISSMNVAGFNSLHNYPVGKIDGNHWGPAVSVFDTTSGTPYFFSFHQRDVGHTTIIGPTGAGKTVLMNFLCAQLQKFNCRMFLFDKDRGSDIFVRALGGAYTILEPGKTTNFNPLQLPDTSENRTFLAEWLKALAMSQGDTFSADDNALIAEAVRGNYKLRKEDRTLRNIIPFMGLEGPGTLAGRMKPWHGNGQYAGLFDNEEDTLDFSRFNVFGFEMGEVIDSKVALAPMLLYLFHKVNMSLDGTPTVIVLDEAWALIDNEIFASKIKDWLKTLRKLNAMVIFATQSVEDATKSSISDTLVQQTATQIFLPNPKATEDYKKAFMVSDREFNLLKTTDPSTRYFLVKQGKDVVVARIDLNGMEDIIHVLSGRAETVRMLEKVRRDVGDDPNEWLPIFQERMARGKY